MSLPRIFPTPDDMEKAIERYKAHVKLSEEKPTLTGMIYFIGIDSRHSFDHYKEYDDGAYIGVIRNAKLYIESSYERNLHESGCTGSIFALKNFGWRDDQNVNMGGQADNPVKATVTVEFVGKD